MQRVRRPFRRLAAAVALSLSLGLTLSVTLGLTLSGSLHAAPQDDPADGPRAALDAVILADGETADRALAVHALAKVNSHSAARGFVESLEKLSARTVKLEQRAERTRLEFKPYSGFSFKDPKAWDIKKRLQEQMDSEDTLLRSDMVVFITFGTAAMKFSDADALKVLTRAARVAEHPTSRRALLSGVLRNALVDPAAVGKIAMKDSDPGVRLVALEALAERKAPETLAIAHKALKEKGWPHRQAASRLLQALKDVNSIAPLVNAMAVEDGRLVEVYAEALRAITGVEIGPFPDAWKAWYDENKAALVAKGAKPQSTKKSKRSVESINYYGIETRSRRIAFLIDVSGSMEEVIGEGLEDVTGLDEDVLFGKKIDIAKKMLKQAIRNLPEESFFNIIVFNHAVKTFSAESLEATQDNKNKSYLMINDLEPSGATFTYGALKEAFRLAGRGLSDKSYDPGVDTIFLLSDGAPTDDNIDKAQPMEGSKILQAVKAWNQLKRVQIHTIAIDPRIGSGPFVRFMRSLAKRNNGDYTEVGNPQPKKGQ